MRRALACATLALAALTVGARAQDRGLSILAQAAERYRGVQTLCADFVQHLSIPLLGDERTGAGRLCQAQPNLFAMRFTDPPGDAIVLDGESVWVYFPSIDTRQVLKAPPERGAQGRDLHREFLEDPETKYQVTYEAEDTVGGARAHRLRLVPRTPAGYRSAVVWIAAGPPVLRRIRIEEENGNVRTITLSNVEFEARAPAGWFSFTPPAGALVIVG